MQNDAKNLKKMTETLAHGYSSEGVQGEQSNQYQHERVKMVFKNLCILLLDGKTAYIFFQEILPLGIYNQNSQTFFG